MQARTKRWTAATLGAVGVFALGRASVTSPPPETTVPTTIATTTITEAPTTVPPATSTPSTTPPPPAGPALLEVVDGDTITVLLPDGTTESVRIIGINAPEGGECFAAEATSALEQRLAGRQIDLQPDTSDRDRFERLLRYLHADGTDIGLDLVEHGFALAVAYPPDIARQGALDAAQESARAARRGLWGACATPDDAVVIVAALAHDPPGNDNLVLNEEWVALRNTASTPLDLTGWTVRDESSSHRFSFPPGFILGPGAVVVIHTGCGIDDLTHLYWCNTNSAVWNNDGDTVMVQEPDGRTHTSYRYGRDRVSDTTWGD